VRRINIDVADRQGDPASEKVNKHWEKGGGTVYYERALPKKGLVTIDSVAGFANVP